MREWGVSTGLIMSWSSVFKVGDAPHVNNFGLGGRGRYRTNLWQYPSPHSGSQCDSELLQQHPTVKPVVLVDDAIKDCSRRGGIILDPFGGSGTTLIAAERTGRCARLTELDPLYTDLIVRRWQQTTGGKAVLTDTNQSFDERAALRLNLEAAR
jgi:DNA modification methylase